MVSALNPDRAVWDRALAGKIMLCSWTRRFIATVPLSIQVKRWILTDLIL